MRCIAIRTTRAWCHNLCALRLVERQLTSFPHYVIGISGMLPYKHSRFFLQYARLYNAAASPASRLRSAGLVGNYFSYQYVPLFRKRMVWVYLVIKKWYYSPVNFASKKVECTHSAPGSHMAFTHVTNHLRERKAIFCMYFDDVTTCICLRRIFPC